MGQQIGFRFFPKCWHVARVHLSKKKKKQLNHLMDKSEFTDSSASFLWRKSEAATVEPS